MCQLFKHKHFLSTRLTPHAAAMDTVPEATDGPVLPAAGTVIAESSAPAPATAAETDSRLKDLMMNSFPPAKKQPSTEGVAEQPPAIAASPAGSTARSSRTSDMSGSTTDWNDEAAMKKEDVRQMKLEARALEEKLAKIHAKIAAETNTTVSKKIDAIESGPTRVPDIPGNVGSYAAVGRRLGSVAEQTSSASSQEVVTQPPVTSLVEPHRLDTINRALESGDSNASHTVYTGSTW